ncbi:MAG: alpha/beta fold hydrolase, partial [Myxococcota bacterium]
GVVALIKTLLCLRNNKLPGVLNLDQVNWSEDDGPLPFEFVTHTQDWPEIASDDKYVPRRAGIHNYGFGGVNTHAIVEDYPAAAPSATGEVGEVAVILSAQSWPQVARQATRLGEFLDTGDHRAWGFSQIAVEEVAFATQCGRETFSHRAALLTSSLSDLSAKLAHLARVLAAAGEGNGDGPDVAAMPVEGIFCGVVDAATQRRWLGLLGEDDRRVIVGNALTQRSMGKLAQLWLAGVEIPWQELYHGQTLRRIPLPTYPFARQRYWIDTAYRPGAELADTARTGAAESLAQASDTSEAVIAVLSRITGVPAPEISTATALDILGLDSLLTTQLSNHLEREHTMALDAAEVRQCGTVGELARLVQRRGRERLAPPSARTGLEALQRGRDGIPSVWLHSALGTIQHYIPLVRQIGRGVPFYAIAARGIRDTERPLDDIVEMARDYREHILASGLDAPIQLGGYSQGGVLAYEIARQLQERGHSVARLILVDAPYPPVVSSLTPVYHVALTFMNILEMNGLTRPGDLGDLVARAEDELTPYLLALGRRRGLTYSPAELEAVVDKYVAILRANLAAMERHELKPLPDPAAMDCHYIARRNPAEFFPAELSGLAEVDEQNRLYAQSDCLRRWSRWLPSLTVHPTTAPDHFAMMSHDEALALMARLCSQRDSAREGHALASEPGAQSPQHDARTNPQPVSQGAQ